MAKHQLVINMNGGLVQDVFGSVPGVQVLVVDWDVGRRSTSYWARNPRDSNATPWKSRRWMASSRRR